MKTRTLAIVAASLAPALAGCWPQPGGTVYVAAGDEVIAFDASVCAVTCAPAWPGGRPAPGAANLAIAGDVLDAGAGDGSVHAFPAHGCGGPGSCTALATVTVGGPPQTIVVAAGHLFVAASPAGDEQTTAFGPRPDSSGPAGCRRISFRHAGGRRGPPRTAPSGDWRGTMVTRGDDLTSSTRATAAAVAADSPRSRRRFLTGVLAAGAALPLAGWGPPGCGAGHPSPPQPPANLPDGLFSLGVASGDPLPHAVVIWTRLAPAPLDGGGMPAVDVPVRWEVSSDEQFRGDVKRGDVVASPQWAHSVHVDVQHLRPAAWYFYRFIVGDQVSPVGRTRTAPAPGHGRDPLRFLFGSCQNWQAGYWPLWAHAPSDDPDVVLHLGDYIYESGISASAVRRHNSSEIRTLDAYRNRYGLYKGDPALQAIHAACPWIVTWDDHETENNYAGLVAENPGEVPDFGARRAAAYQAWWEHQPVRLAPPTGPDLRIYRSFDWGRLARFHVVDTRQYRDPQACSGSLGPTCDDRTAPGRTLLGPEQEAWLGDSFASSTATWDVLANQIVMTSMPFAGSLYNPDQWDGYTAARTRALDLMAAGGVDNAVVLTGDIHAAGVADLVDENPDGTPSTIARGTELVGGSISSTFPADLADVAEELIMQLPHVRFADTHQRGYMVCDVTQAEMVTRYQVAESTLVPDSPVTTAGTWTTVAGTPGVQSS